MTAILSMKAARATSELRRLLHDGVLAQRGGVDLGGGTLLPLDIACRIVLSDLDDLIDHTTNNGSIARDRLQQLSDELEHLYSLAVPPSGG
jgi:hypothetical protein